MQKVFLLNLNEYLRNLPISGGYQMSYSDIGMHRIKPVYMNTDVRTPPPPPHVSILYAHTDTRNCERCDVSGLIMYA